MNGGRSAAGRRGVAGVRGAGADITCGGGPGGSGGGGGATVTGYSAVSDTDPRAGATSGATAHANTSTNTHDHATRAMTDPLDRRRTGRRARRQVYSGAGVDLL
jgi:hypothetical protein